MKIIPYNGKIPNIKSSASIFAGAIIAGDVTIEDNVSIWFNATIRGDMASITIGKDTNIQDNAVIHVNTNLPTKIGKRCTIGHSAILHACTIEDDCLIGMGAIVLDGATVQKGAMVAAGALVPPGKVVPSGMLAVGSPMKIVRQLTNDEQKANLENMKHYLSLKSNYI
jgi:carbonic anhydrase/acetyltransferase-like protein (isoleucine patch superfamily)